MKKNTQYDVIIIGGSYAGLTAGMALGRAIRQVLIIDSGNPANKQTPYSHNFLTNDGKKPAEIAAIGKEQVQFYDTVNFFNGFATHAKMNGNGFDVQVARGETFTASKLVFATGIKDRMPAIPGFAESWGISVLHCPYCHGYEVRGRKTGILANGTDDFSFTSLIANWTNDLTLYTNGPSSLSAMEIKKLRDHHIAIEEKEIEQLIHTDGSIKTVVFLDGSEAAIDAFYARVPFTQHSAIPVELGCELTTDGYIKIDQEQRTTIHGVYASGDNATRMRTVANAVSMGTTTGLMVNKALIEEAF